jgi:peptide/nickel transport system substrate-binding protein
MNARRASATNAGLLLGMTIATAALAQKQGDKSFSAADVKCTYDLLMGKAKEKLRLNFREAWFLNLADVTTNGDTEATFHLNRPQPAFFSLLVAGYSPIYPCHVLPRDMRSHPIGTGPFKFVEYTPNQSIKVTRNPDYWKPGRPYLDGIEYTMVANRSTAILAFATGKFDMTFPYDVTVPLLTDVKSQAPQAVCELKPMNGRANSARHRRAPVRQPGIAPGNAVEPRPQGFHRHSE